MYFYISWLSSPCLEEFNKSFKRTGLDLGNKRRRRQAIFARCQSDNRVVTDTFSGSPKTKSIKSKVHLLPLKDHLM